MKSANFCHLIFDFFLLPCHRQGQAITEMVFVIPLLLMVLGGTAAVVYICEQGIKVQQAANLAARIQGQERVAGGLSYSVIQQDNGVSQGGDVDPTMFANGLDKDSVDALKQNQHRRSPATTVYGKIQMLVREMFTSDEQNLLFVPLPQYGLVGYSDQVKVIRVWQPPAILSMQMSPVTVQATAYGGEDSHMYGLVRWGHTNQHGVGDPFWAERSVGSGQSGRTNLPNPKHD